MRSPKHRHWLLLAALLPAIAARAQAALTAQTAPTEVLTHREPARIALNDLYKLADIVALVQVIAGDTESYEQPVYKAKIVANFKGSRTGDTIFFGPYVGTRLGTEYVLFLRRAKRDAAPKTNTAAPWGTINYFEVFNEGYSSMETSYECVFDKRHPDRNCDSGVRVCTDYIVLPKGTNIFPSEGSDPPFGCGWVRKDKLVSLLAGMEDVPLTLPSK